MNFQRLLDDFKRQGNKVATFLRTREVVAFLFFLLLAFGLWYMHSAGTQREMRDSLFIKYVGVPGCVRFDKPLPETISFVIKDEGRQLWRYRSHEYDTILVDMSDRFASDNSVEIEFEKQLQKILQQLSPTARLVELTPGYFVSEYYRLESKVVPVMLSDDIRLAPQYVFAAPVSISPSEVTVYGPDAELNRISCVYAESVDREFSDSETFSLPLVKVDGVDFSVASVDVSVPVEMCTEKEVEVPILKKNVPDGLVVRTFPSMAKVRFSVGLSRYNEVYANMFEVVFDYDKAVASDNVGCVLDLSVKPEEVFNIHIVPNEVEYVIEREN